MGLFSKGGAAAVATPPKPQGPTATAKPAAFPKPSVAPAASVAAAFPQPPPTTAKELAASARNVPTPTASSNPQPERSPYFQKMKVRIHQQLVERLDVQNLKTLPPEVVRREVRVLIRDLCQEEKGLLSNSDQEKLMDEVMDETFGLGPLETLLKDPTISDILVNRFDSIYVERKGRLELSDVTFRDNSHLRQIIDRIVALVGRRVDETSPMVDARLMDGSRVNAIIPPLALDGPAMSIRRFGSKPMMPEDLIRAGAFPPAILDFLAAAVQARCNVLISGGTGSGKTTLLNCLSRYISAEERVITIEDAAELQLQQDHIVRLETRPANIEGKGAINCRDLVKNALRMRPERIIIGECRGAEALDMLQAMNTGHAGSMTTLHANTPRDAQARLETMVMMAGMELPIKAMRQQISSAVDMIVQANRLQGGPRKVTSISEVMGMEGDVIIMQEIFRFKQLGIDQNGRSYGQFEASGVRPAFIPRLEAAGIKLPTNLFQERVLMRD